MDELESYVRRLFVKLQERNEKTDDGIKSFQEKMEERFVKNTSSQVMGKKKRPRQDDQDKENESTASESQADQASMDQTALRPVRTAKINANKNLKEPDLAKKMRQPSAEELLQLEKIKEEPADVPHIKRETGTKKKVKKEPLSLLPPPPEGPRTSKDSDIEVLAQPEEIVEVLSDNETDRMPPPALPAPKARKARTKKKKTSAENPPIRESQIKKELPPVATITRSSSRKASGESQYEDALDVPVPPVMPRTESPVPMNATFDVAPEGAEVLHNSLMTEDNSVEIPPEDLLPLKQLKKKHPHELFNPCVQSPLRTKVEAFERHAAASALPVPKVKVPEERVTQGTPLGAKGTTTLFKSASTSKLAHISGIGATKKPRAGTASASKATTRSASAEDTKRGLNALQQVAEEKRRKREERHKQAQLAREAKEREKEERHRRLMQEQQEREEKMRAERNKAMKAKTAQEKDQERKLEEMQRHKAAQKHRAAEKYGFEMLCSDDSTDDEGKASTKRPQPPLWSQKPRRKELNAIQECIPQQLIDRLFMLQPMSPDLKEIFPDIDPRNLHRNSSVVWATPPKY